MSTPNFFDLNYQYAMLAHHVSKFLDERHTYDAGMEEGGTHWQCFNFVTNQFGSCRRENNDDDTYYYRITDDDLEPMKKRLALIKVLEESKDKEVRYSIDPTNGCYNREP